jgi:hypothetical protein
MVGLGLILDSERFFLLYSVQTGYASYTID